MILSKLECFTLTEQGYKLFSSLYHISIKYEVSKTIIGLMIVNRKIVCNVFVHVVTYVL